MCRALRKAYTKNGGSHPELLAQFAAAEKKAVGLMNGQQSNPFQAGISLLHFIAVLTADC